VAVLAALLASAGCGRAYDVGPPCATPERAQKGLIAIFPGVEGESRPTHDVRAGLHKAGIPYAIVIYRWGVPAPILGIAINQIDIARNRRQGEKIAAQILAYQHSYPGAPVFLVGHSAGGAIAVFTLEALGRIPGAEPIEGVFLLSSSISACYDLSDALKMTRRGIVNLSNVNDTLLLGAVTSTFGNLDGGHGNSAGRTGFVKSYDKVYERRLTDEGARQLGISASSHFVGTSQELVVRYAPMWILGDRWPAVLAGLP
jgi:pimeloyl-ACP methyl ester carboxylesterase